MSVAQFLLVLFLSATIFVIVMELISLRGRRKRYHIKKPPGVYSLSHPGDVLEQCQRCRKVLPTDKARPFCSRCGWCVDITHSDHVVIPFDEYGNTIPVRSAPFSLPKIDGSDVKGNA